MAERTASSRKVFLIRVLIAGLVLTGVGAFFAYKPAKQRYRVWKQQRALVQAREFLAANDLPAAKLALDVALMAVPGNLDALRAAADFLDQANMAEAMRLRRQILMIEPGSTADRAALVMAALRFRDLNAAREAVAGFEPAQAERPEALQAALAYALATDNRPVADLLFDRLDKVGAGNGNTRVMHAVLRLKHPKPEIVAAARAELDELAKEPRTSLFIHRELMMYALARRDSAEAKRQADAVVADPRARLGDRLSRANLALNLDKQPFADVMATLVPHVGSEPSDVAEFVRWLLLVGRAKEAEAWLATQANALTNEAEVRAAQAEVVIALADWDRLEGLITGGVWGPVTRDPVRLAFAARVAGNRGNATLQTELWDEALAAAGGTVRDLRVLHRLAVLWRWNEQIERTLWVIVRAAPSEAWAHQTLFSHYRSKGDTKNLVSLMATLRDLDATVPRYRHDWALLSVLTSSGSTWTPAKEMLERLHGEEPGNAAYATGYAFALAKSGRAKEAAAVADKLNEMDRSLAARAPYLAYIYGQARRADDFEKASALQPPAESLLPEERLLISLARDALQRGGAAKTAGTTATPAP